MQFIIKVQCNIHPFYLTFHLNLLDAWDLSQQKVEQILRHTHCKIRHTQTSNTKIGLEMNFLCLKYWVCGGGCLGRVLWVNLDDGE